MDGGSRILNLNNRGVIKIIDDALKEDIRTGDITTDSVIGNKEMEVEGVVTAKENGVIAGLEIAELVFQRLNKNIDFNILSVDGRRVEKGTPISRVKGDCSSILKGERLALNFLQRLSGIATKTAEYKKLVEDLDVDIVDTRKTTPNLRVLEKYAVRTGGGKNHRFGLYDAVMIKDNHIKAVGSISAAVQKAKQNTAHTVKIEVETSTLDEVKEAIDVQVDIIMLDNMSIEQMKKAVEMVNDKAVSIILEASGGITRKNLREVAETGVDVISLGTLTHTIDSLDIGLDLL